MVGGFVENHDGEIGFFGPYAKSPQWASQSPVTRGVPFMYANTRTRTGLAEYAGSGCYAYVNLQPDYDYAAPWTRTFHATGLPSGVSRG